MKQQKGSDKFWVPAVNPKELSGVDEDKSELELEKKLVNDAG